MSSLAHSLDFEGCCLATGGFFEWVLASEIKTTIADYADKRYLTFSRGYVPQKEVEKKELASAFIRKVGRTNYC